eukprot:2402704-Amphidinium_carterae.1
MADVCDRYNIGQVAIGVGDLGLAYQAQIHGDHSSFLSFVIEAFKIAVSVDPSHADQCITT